MEKKEIYTLNLDTFQYEPRKKPKFATVEAAKPIDDLKTRFKALVTGMDKSVISTVISIMASSLIFHTAFLRSALISIAWTTP